jgi:hypothetical protein
MPRWGLIMLFYNAFTAEDVYTDYTIWEGDKEWKQDKDLEVDRHDLCWSF